MEDREDASRREEALCYYVSSMYQQLGASEEAVERARRLPVLRPRARCVIFCYTDRQGGNAGCVRLSVDWGLIGIAAASAPPPRRLPDRV